MDFITIMRQRLIEKVVPRLVCAQDNDQFQSADQIRGHVNENYTTFAIANLTDEEFAFLQVCMAEYRDEGTAQPTAVGCGSLSR